MQRLTDEQNHAVDLFAAGGDLKIIAFAGAGKTRTLEAMADEISGPALYLAFNRSIAAEARARFPQGTRCVTLHSLAYRALADRYATAKLADHLSTADLVEILGLSDRYLGPAELTARVQAALVQRSLERFLHGADDEPRPADVILPAPLTRAAAGECLQLIRDTVEHMRLLWAQMVDPCNPVPLGHDGYLKLWALERPRLEVDHIFLDEAQDTNPVALDLLRRQRAQVVYVGDPHQQIYAWRGAIDAMTRVPTARTAHLTQGFRFGAEIAEAATRVLFSLGEERRLKGNPLMAGRVERCAPDAVVARTNAGVVDAVLDALMIAERPYVVGGTGDLLRLLVDVERLKSGSVALTAELAGFARWSEVQDAAHEPGSDFAPLVRLVEEHGEDRLISALGRVARDEAGADVVVTTTHRAKGREWDRVQLRDDFGRVLGLIDGNGRFDPAEARLFYVALTRARLAVDVPDELSDFYCGERPDDASKLLEASDRG